MSTKTRFTDTAATQLELAGKLHLANILGGSFEFNCTNNGVVEFKITLPDTHVEMYRHARTLPVW